MPQLPVTTLICATALAASAGVAAPAYAGHGPAHPGQGMVKPSPYVALGDSYASGAGIAPLDPTADPRCSRSLLNYAHVVAQRVGSRQFTDVSCGGADTADFAGSQHPGVAPQLTALSKRTRLVTMTIGGNDAGVFGNLLAACTTASFADPTGNPCERQQGDTFTKAINTQTYPNVLKALQAVRRHAPRAKVAILGYPRILPAKGSAACTATMLIAQGDVPYVNTIEKTLNGVIRKAARQAGVTYVDTWQASEGKDACAAPGVRWVEPVVPINAAPVHPNARGERGMATQTIKQLGLRTH